MYGILSIYYTMRVVFSEEPILCICLYRNLKADMEKFHLLRIDEIFAAFSKWTVFLFHFFKSFKLLTSIVQKQFIFLTNHNKSSFKRSKKRKKCNWLYTANTRDTQQTVLKNIKKDVAINEHGHKWMVLAEKSICFYTTFSVIEKNLKRIILWFLFLGEYFGLNDIFSRRFLEFLLLFS